MLVRIVAAAALAGPLVFASGPARADCLWDVGMTERDLMTLERAAPLAADPNLPLGPGGPDRIGGERDFAERAKLAFGTGDGLADAAQSRAAVIEARIIWARSRLAAARRYAALGDMEGCAAAVDQARNAIAGARAAFR